MIRKLSHSRGETLAETLVAVLIVTLSVLFLTTAAVSAARINRASAEQDTAFHRAEASSGTVEVKVKKGDAPMLTMDADLFVTGQGTETDKDDYRYYRFRPEEAG